MRLIRIWAVTRKEFLHVLRDARSLGMAIAIPMMMLMLFGYALTLDVDKVPLVVWDQSDSPESRELASRFLGSCYFAFSGPARDYADVERAIDTGPAPDAGAGGSGGAGGGGGNGGSGGPCCHLVGTSLANPSPCGPSEADTPWQTLDNAGCNANGCTKLWCPYEKCDTSRYPSGCPQGTEACWIDNSFATYEDACASCCESYGACWDTAISTCRHPGDCGTPIWKCPWQP